jgi:hypothetical protein
MCARKGRTSGRCAGTRRDGRKDSSLPIGFVVLLLIASSVLLNSAGAARATVAAASTIASLGDNEQVSTFVGGVTYILNDTIVTETLTSTSRSYEVVLHVNHPLPGYLVSLSTAPVVQWGGPNQIPGGEDSLPPLSSWEWTVYRGSASDNKNWSVDSANGTLYRSVAWGNSTFKVTGVPSVSVAIQVTPGAATGPVAPGPGYFPLTQVPRNDPQYTAEASALDPGVVRFSQTYAASASWNTETGTPSFNLTVFSTDMNFTEALGAQVYLSFPAGSWGDGNLLPAGMPLNYSLWVNWWGHGSGYFPTITAYTAYLTAFASLVKSHGWSIEYWNIGNEVPVGVNVTVAAAFVTLFNAAARAVHSVLPNALVGSDVFTWPGREKFFATAIQGAGFLAFHAYPATNLCPTPSQFCVPDNVNGYLTDPTILASSDNFSDYPWTTSPLTSQEVWHNLTGQWLPMIDAETNLNSAQTQGTDPRIPTLFDAAWFISQLVDGAAQNVSSILYLTLGEGWPPCPSPTEQYGGWGFGLIAHNMSDQDIKFASYWALELWASAIPLGSRELPITDSNAGVVRAFAAASGPNISVIVANRVDADVTIPVSSTNASWVAVNASTLDSNSYRMVYNPSTQTEELLTSGLGYPAASGRSSMSLTLAGYGVGVVTFSAVSKATYTTKFSETGLPTNTIWSVTVGSATHRSNSSAITFNLENGSYSFSVGAIPGYTPSPSGGTVKVAGMGQTKAITFTANPASKYSITLDETGLPSKTIWSVTVGSVTHRSNSSAITFNLENGSYSFSVGAIPGYTPSPSGGTVKVAGMGQTKAITFTANPASKYNVTFDETGLPSKTNWSVTVGSVERSSASSIVALDVGNGTYNYSVGPVPGYTSSLTGGVVTVAGTGQTIAVTFTADPSSQFSVTFEETGLPSRTNWSVILGTEAGYSSSTEVVFLVTNGTSAYSIPSIPSFTVTSPSGSVTVSGANQTVSVTFDAIPPGEYTVTFVEAGLPSGTSWTVTMDSVNRQSTTPSIAFLSTNGSRPYSIGAVSDYTVSQSSGSVVVAGTSVSVPLVFTASSVGPPSGRSGNNTTAASGNPPGVGPSLLSWLTLDFLGPLLGAYVLIAVRIALVTVFPASLLILVARRSRRRTIASRATARVVRVSGLTLPGWKPPPDARPGAPSRTSVGGFDWRSAPYQR